nr:MAG TPA: hypothetical protein [Caudoviricetes sp.]
MVIVYIITLFNGNTTVPTTSYYNNHNQPISIPNIRTLYLS